MTDNCDLCGKFMSTGREQVDFCDHCDQIIRAEEVEFENGIGNGQVCYIDEDICRHCIKKWPMSEILYNALYGVVE